MRNPTILRQTAYIPSASEYDQAWKKFRAFMIAKLSNKLIKAGEYYEHEEEYMAGEFLLRTDHAGSLENVDTGESNGTRSWNYAFTQYGGLRVAFNLSYNQECHLVKGCEEETRTSLVYENGNKGPVYDGNGEDKEVTSTAPIITLENGTKCIWLNKEECKAEYAKGKPCAMQLWTLDLVERAKPFARNSDHNDWAKAKELHTQCKNWVQANLSKKEKKMLVPVVMSSVNGYEKATPILEEKNVVPAETINKLKKEYENLKISQQRLWAKMTLEEKIEYLAYQEQEQEQYYAEIASLKSNTPCLQGFAEEELQLSFYDNNVQLTFLDRCEETKLENS